MAIWSSLASIFTKSALGTGLKKSVSKLGSTISKTFSKLSIGQIGKLGIGAGLAGVLVVGFDSSTEWIHDLILNTTGIDIPIEAIKALVIGGIALVVVWIVVWWRKR